MWESRIDRQIETKESSHELMRSSNPSVIPRNHRVEEALEAAQRGDYSVMDKLLKVLSKPYAHLPEQDDYTKLPPQSSCSYRAFCGT
jgi:uncharacterized protein YdiU (UPF0061 family)